MISNPNPTASHLVIGLGEVLFDCFPGRKVLGGAPVNVAVHAHQLLGSEAGQGVVVSRVGQDDLGRDLIEQLDSRGIDTRAIQRDLQFPTGTVQVELTDEGEPTYTIETDVAWENLHWDDSLEQLASSCSAVCFGSLAQRSEPSRSTILRFVNAASSAIRFFDINLRQNFYTADILATSLQAASVVKLNEAELSVVCDLLTDHTGGKEPNDQAIYQLQQSFGLDYVALTRGSEGTVLYHDGSRTELEPVSLDRADNADNVGAGDACSAGLVVGLLRGWQPQQIVALANRMGAFVASQPGATPQLTDELLNFAP